MTKRSEWKYLIDPLIVNSLLEFIKAHGVRDSFTNADGFYQVNSLYLDTPDWICYRSKVSGLDPRFKLRWRWYGDETHKVMLELKRRSAHSIYKNSVAFDKIKEIFEISHELPSVFEQETIRHSFHPVLTTRYIRHAYFFGENFRVTLDTDLSFASLNETFLSDDRIVLEIKGEGDIPSILTEMLNMFKLRLVSFSKYQNGVERLFHV